ncbi:MAG: DNA-directed RNA polymerase subunit alpha [Elusimicrobia bacterium RIFCSPLOWO2_01_FULL_64_13]|nr:MAG: DNA-directed RNA polymerase subunit alpha [Elusimicrobia bacterium RIFCSPHIGHO2_01_FULL_64_10]OGR96548.1 MAG: DNA-directed RNA polymerase subunit alpha [Elusimicrobia bacterium RIFCSPLOWO2_01_FULL_64_13]
MKLQDFILPEKIEFEKEKLSDVYGKFTAEPFERGYGHTIGNSLRRILLSSLEGAAVTAVRVQGAPHEYSVVRGVREDVMEIILNLKRLRFKMYSQNPEILRLSVSKASVVKASDFAANTNVEIINHDLVIAHLDPGGKLELEVEVSRGRGYLPSERNSRPNRPIDFIATDALFSPVTKVYYEVENARVGQITDYDRLILEVWTDGSIGPLDAMSYSAKVLKDSVSVFITVDEENAPPPLSVSSGSAEKEVSNELLNKLVSEIELSVRATNCLKNAKINTLGELVRKTEDELLTYKNFGKKSLDEIKDKLKELDLSLGMQI